MGVLTAPHSFQHLLSAFWILATLIGVEWQLGVDLLPLLQSRIFSPVWYSLPQLLSPIFSSEFPSVYLSILSTFCFHSRCPHLICHHPWIISKISCLLNNATIVIFSKSRSKHGTWCPKFSGNFPIYLYYAQDKAKYFVMTYNVLYGCPLLLHVIWCHVPILSTVNLLVLSRVLEALFEDILFPLLIMTFILPMPHFSPLHLPSLILPILPFYSHMLYLGRGSPELTKEGEFSYYPHMIQCILYEKL